MLSHSYSATKAGINPAPKMSEHSGPRKSTGSLRKRRKMKSFYCRMEIMSTCFYNDIEQTILNKEYSGHLLHIDLLAIG